MSYRNHSMFFGRSCPAMMMMFQIQMMMFQIQMSRIVSRLIRMIQATDIAASIGHPVARASYAQTHGRTASRSGPQCLASIRNEWCEGGLMGTDGGKTWQVSPRSATASPAGVADMIASSTTVMPGHDRRGLSRGPLHHRRRPSGPTTGGWLSPWASSRRLQIASRCHLG